MQIRVSPKPAINDPEGDTIARALGRLGFSGIESLRAGKYFDVSIVADSKSDADRQVSEMCERLLANPVIEHYSYEIEEVD